MEYRVSSTATVCFTVRGCANEAEAIEKAKALLARDDGNGIPTERECGDSHSTVYYTDFEGTLEVESEWEDAEDWHTPCCDTCFAKCRSCGQPCDESCMCDKCLAQ